MNTNNKTINPETDFFSEMLEESRLFLVLHDILSEEIKTSNLYNTVKSYLKNYITYNKITTESIIEYYSNFIKTYNVHCKEFIETCNYPNAYESKDHPLSRKEYDVILLLSVLFTPHRFKIMQLLVENNPLTTEKALFIGLGPGLELALTRDQITEVDTYDLSADDFLFTEFPDVQINKTYYNGQKENYYNTIFLIEILEHIEDPYHILRICYKSLAKGGSIFLTTASNIPQFDHVYNFPINHSGFEKKITKMGFVINKKVEICHEYLTLDMKSSNHFYILEKK